MKLIDIALILALITASILASVLMDQVIPARTLPVPITSGSRAALVKETRPASSQPAVRRSGLSEIPAAQIAVGLVCLLFSPLAVFPLFFGSGRNFSVPRDERTE